MCTILCTLVLILEIIMYTNLCTLISCRYVEEMEFYLKKTSITLTF